MEAGALVIMLRVERGTRVLHTLPCGELPHSPGRPTTWAQAFELWGVQRNARLGYRDAQRIVDTHPFFTGAPQPPA